MHVNNIYIDVSLSNLVCKFRFISFFDNSTSGYIGPIQIQREYIIYVCIHIHNMYIVLVKEIDFALDICIDKEQTKYIYIHFVLAFLCSISA